MPSLSADVRARTAMIPIEEPQVAPATSG